MSDSQQQQGKGEAAFYLYAVLAGDNNIDPGSVFYKVAGETVASGLCALFAKEYEGKDGRPIFRHVAAATVPAPDQVLLDEALQWLEVYSDPDPGVHDPPPSKDMIARAQYAVRAQTWEELLRRQTAVTESPNGEASGDKGASPPPSTDKVPDMPAEDWRNAGLNLLMLLAQAYYKLLESAIGVPCGAVDLELNHSYLWTLKNIRNLLGNHPDLADFPGPFEPVFPDLLPSTVRDVDWEDMVAPDAERFLSTVQEYVMEKGVYPPEERSPAWVFIELFKPGVTSAIESGGTYRKHMNQHLQKMLVQMSKRVPAPVSAPGASETRRPTTEQKSEPSRTASHVSPEVSNPDRPAGSSMPDGWKDLPINRPFESRMMQWNSKPFAIEEPAICYKGHDLENQSLEDYYPDLREDWDRHIKDVPFDEVENLRILRLVGGEKTLLIHVMIRESVPVYPERLESSGEADGWHEGGVVVVDGQRVEVKGIHVEPTDPKVRAKIEAARRSRVELPGTEHEKAPGESHPKQAARPPRTVRRGKAASRSLFDWVKQAELVRALQRVIGDEESPDKATLTRAVQDGQIQSNGDSGRKCLLQVDSVKAWLTRRRNMDHTEVQQVVDAIIAEIRMRPQKH